MRLCRWLVPLLLAGGLGGCVAVVVISGNEAKATAQALVRAFATTRGGE